MGLNSRCNRRWGPFVFAPFRTSRSHLQKKVSAGNDFSVGQQGAIQGFPIQLRALDVAIGIGAFRRIDDEGSTRAEVDRNAPEDRTSDAVRPEPRSIETRRKTGLPM